MKKVYVVYHPDYSNSIDSMWSTREKALAQLKNIYDMEYILEQDGSENWNDYCDSMFGEIISYDDYINGISSENIIEWAVDEEND